ncbi:EAL domain-containing protein [Motiliproteus sp. MSK22-1]|uniref:EAL domain-containing protein n=1 Tax=Motiliproteus sp. MSK22-1 TaxID=1897630 RepID=UPI000978515E|nr:EAL domain-containing protein [Motiliproteus sp. MSK22-1]OMH38255.1 diguanylate cyclase [Motiliproteus sp. MSK22-1]
MTVLPQLLLVNSDNEQRKTLCSYIKSSGHFDVIEAESGKDAAAVLKKSNISCVVSDIYIGALDGWRLARMVRSGVFNCSETTPFIIVASTWCKRIAETTAREFDIDHVLPFAQHQRLDILLKDSLIPRTSTRKDCVLAIEDAPDTAHLIQRILRNRFDVDIAEDGPIGLEMWKQKKHSIVLLDVMLPGMSGPDVMDLILAENPNQTIVIMTAHGTMDLAEELMLKGASDFVSKPFRTEQLRKVCEVAARREDFLISNEQFAQTVDSLKENERVRISQAKEHQDVLDTLSTVILELDHDGCIIFANKAWNQLTGLTTAESLNKPFIDSLRVDDEHTSTSVISAINNLYEQRTHHCRLEFKLLDKYDQEIWVEARLNRVKRDNNPEAISVALDDISARKSAEKRLEHLALHDTLTGLYNRYYFDNELRRLASQSRRSGSNHSLLYLDLDHFKTINDTQGHNQGDFILKSVASKLQHRLRETDSLCRIGGDEFAVLLNNTDIAQAEIIAKDLCELVAADQYRFGDRIYKISCSIGISVIDGLAEKAQKYLQRADIALYVAKRHGRNLVHVYTSGDKDSEDVKSSMEWLHKLQHAIEQDNLLLHYQPIVHIESGQVAYYEALVRLNIDNRMVFPGEFIPALERLEDANLLDHQVVGKAIKALSEHPELIKVSINLSAQAFSDERLVPLIEDKLEKFAVDPQRVIFELTESASLSNLSATQRMVSELSKMGCGFSIDDFGTGFSTFTYLKNLPADTVKIDGSFVKELTNNTIDLALVKAIREVANALDKSTVAEFVEDQETLTLLKEIKVDYAQGYFLGRPKPIEELGVRDLENESSAS